MIKSLFKAVFIITVFSISTRVLGFLLKIFLSRQIGAEGLGIFQVALSIAMIFITLVSSGLPLIVSKKTAEFEIQNDKKSQHKIVSASMIIGIIVSITCCALLIVFKDFLTKYIINENSVTILITLIPSIIASSVLAGITGNLWGRQKHLQNCLIEFFEQLLRLVLCFFIVLKSENPIDGAINAGMALSISCVVTLFVAFILYYKSGGRLSRPNKHFSPLIKSALPITGVRLVGSLAQPLIAIIVPLRLMSVGYTSSQALSQFGAATGMTLSLLYVPITLIGALATALIPQLATLFAKNDTIQGYSKIKNALRISVIASCLFIPLFMALGEEIGLFFFDNLESGVYLIKSAWIMLPLCLSAITSSILNVLGLEIKSFKNYCIGSIFLLLAIVILPKYIGINCLGLGLGLCMSLVTILNLKMIYKYTNMKRFLLPSILKTICACVPTYFLAKFSFGILNTFLIKFFALAFSSIIGFITFISLISVFNIMNIKSIFIEYRQNRRLSGLVKSKKIA